jgi:hypothetical protein
MNAQLSIDFDKATTERDKGIETSRAHADDQIPEWGSLALAELRRWILAVNVDTFLLEDFRLAAERNIPIPPDKRAWGHVVLRAYKAGWIRKAGLRVKKSANQHCCYGTAWEVQRGKL